MTTFVIALTVLAVWFAIGFTIAIGMAILRQAAHRWDELAARQARCTDPPRACPPRPRKGAWKDRCEG